MNHIGGASATEKQPEGYAAMLAVLPAFLRDDYAASLPVVSSKAPACDVVAQSDRIELWKYVADREVRLARTWHQIASNSIREKRNGS